MSTSGRQLVAVQSFLPKSDLRNIKDILKQLGNIPRFHRYSDFRSHARENTNQVYIL